MVYIYHIFNPFITDGHSTIKRRDLICGNMDETRGCYVKWNTAQKDKQHTFSLT
jgi:hypothetical protein